MLEIGYQEMMMMVSVFFRVLLSASLGAIIGIDRVKKRRPAGIKTHALVCMGATLVMLTSEYLYLNFDGSTDIARLSAQVISGVGFLGAGTIMVTGRNQIKGLTTAAGLWFSATLGLAIGSGFYVGVASSMIILFLITRVFSLYDHYLQRNSYVMDVYVELDAKVPIGVILRQIKEQGCHINELDKIESHGTGDQLFHLSIGLNEMISHQQLIHAISTISGVNYIDEI